MDVWGRGGAGGRHLLAEAASPAARARPAAHGLRLAPRPAGGGAHLPSPPPAPGMRGPLGSEEELPRLFADEMENEDEMSGERGPAGGGGARAAGCAPAPLAPRGQGRGERAAKGGVRPVPPGPARARGAGVPRRGQPACP